MVKNDFASLWATAMARYAEITGKDFKDLLMPGTTDELIQSVDRQNGDYVRVANCSTDTRPEMLIDCHPETLSREKV